MFDFALWCFPPRAAPAARLKSPARVESLQEKFLLFDRCFQLWTRRRSGVKTHERPAELSLCPPPDSRRGCFKDSSCFVVAARLWTVFSSVPSPEGRSRGGGGASCGGAHPPHIKRQRAVEFLPQPLYGRLMIYCSDFSLFSSYLEGASLTSSLFFSPGLQIVLSHREMCHGATVCSTAVTQFRDFFTRAASAGEQRNPARKADPTGTLLQNPQPGSSPRWSACWYPHRVDEITQTQKGVV